MADPNVIPNAYGDDLYASLAPMAFGDEDNNYALKTYCYANGQMYSQLEQFARTDAAGNPAYSLLFDLDRATGDLIPYIAQYAGQEIPKGIDDATARALVRKPSNAERGTLAAVVKAVLATLTGTKYLRLIERDTSAYHFSVFTRTAETPDVAATARAIDSVKPAGLIYSLVVTAGKTIDELVGTIDALTGAVDNL